MTVGFTLPGFTLLCFLLGVLPVGVAHGQTPAAAPNPFAVRAEPGATVTYRNPVLPGFYSDPSVVRVGEDYYLVTSTFEYFPGVPVFHSRDLVHWTQIGHAIERPTQLPEGLNIFACTLRHHDGTFYMVTTNVGRGGNFFVTASDPAGPWSDPVWLDVEGIDPDLFFDDDGKVYTIGSSFTLQEIDPQTGAVVSERRQVWATTGGRYAEGPHLYKKDGWYYLLAAEGGTEEAHSQTIARSHSIWGPYYSYPANPVLAHANAAGQGNPIQGVGHADLVEAHDGSWWLLFHGYRTVTTGVHHTLGRETMLAPVSWPKNGWPQVNGNGTVTVEMTAPTLPLVPASAPSSRTRFDGDALGLEWNYVQYPDLDRFSLAARPGYLRLLGSALTIDDTETMDDAAAVDGLGSPVFTGRRLQHLGFTATTLLDFEPAGGNEEAGLTLLNHGTHFDLLVKRSGERRVLVVRLEFGTVAYESEPVVLAPGPVALRVESTGPTFTFSYAQGSESSAQDRGPFTPIETVEARYLSSETVGGFTGTYVGLYATGNGTPSVAPADFDWFEYTPASIP